MAQEVVKGTGGGAQKGQGEAWCQGVCNKGAKEMIRAKVIIAEVIISEKNATNVTCRLELPFKDPITGNDFIIFGDGTTIMESTYIKAGEHKVGYYREVSHTIKTLFDRIDKNVGVFLKDFEKRQLYGGEVE